MKLQYFGTAAAEGVPGMFCDCEICKRSRAAGGRNIRTRSQSLVDDKVLIDFPADTYWHVMQHGLPLSKIHTCIITHNHSDHLYPSDLENRSYGMAPKMDDETPMTFYACKSAYDAIMKEIERFNLAETKRVFCELIKPFEPFEAEGYTITPIEASHDPNADPVIYIIEKDGKGILYANDTGILKDVSKEYLKNCGKHFDLISLDCTMQNGQGFFGHFNWKQCLEFCDELAEWGLIDDGTKCVVNHFSHNGGWTYDDLCEIAKNENFEVSYDGMTIEF